MTRFPDAPGEPRLHREGIRAKTGTEHQLVNDIDRGRRPADPHGRADGMGQARKVDEHDDAAASLAGEMERVPDETIGQATPEGRIGNNVPGA
ncbi:MAG: hypothetical protein AB7E81_16525 [Hyphomicrobiaceae bacterium]